MIVKYDKDKKCWVLLDDYNGYKLVAVFSTEKAAQSESQVWRSTHEKLVAGI
jgi:hypothetical protein